MPYYVAVHQLWRCIAPKYTACYAIVAIVKYTIRHKVIAYALLIITGLVTQYGAVYRLLLRGMSFIFVTCHVSSGVAVIQHGNAQHLMAQHAATRCGLARRGVRRGILQHAARRVAASRVIARAPEPEALERQSSGSSEPEAEASETQAAPLAARVAPRFPAPDPSVLCLQPNLCPPFTK